MALSTVEQNWNKEETLYMISQFKKYPNLYQVNHNDHLNLRKRNDDFLRILKEVSVVKLGVSLQSVKSKLKTLRNQLTRENKRMIHFKKLGQPYKPKLWCYDDLLFLRNDYVECKQTSNRNVSVGKVSSVGLHQKVRYKYDNKPNPIEVALVDDLQVADHQKLRSKSENDPVEIAPEEDFDLDEVPMRNRKLARLDMNIGIIQKSTMKSLEMLSSLVDKPNLRTPVPRKECFSKEDAFSNYLSTELKQLKLEETFDEVKMDIMHLVNKAKAKEKQLLNNRSQSHRNSLRNKPTSSKRATSIHSSCDSDNSMGSLFGSSTINRSVLLRRGKFKTKQDILKEVISSTFSETDIDVKIEC